MTYNILVLCGGDGSEHEISLTSAKFIAEQLQLNPEFNVISCVIHNHQFLINDKAANFVGKSLQNNELNFNVDCVIPCLHGFPGETGDIQSFLEILNIPYIGCKSESSRYCFNKITTKLYLDALGIPNSPSQAILSTDESYKKKALEFFELYKDVYVKAASQGSSVGCYHVTDKDCLWDKILEAFNYSSEVLLEKSIAHRELEVAAYEMDRGLIITTPGEIIMPDNVFYTFEEKYSQNSSTVTTVTPKGLSSEEIETIQDYARRAFIGLKLRDLSRIDFFLSPEDGILINEINTFPGETPISMFPKMLTHHGDNMCEFLTQAVIRAIKSR